MFHTGFPMSVQRMNSPNMLAKKQRLVVNIGTAQSHQTQSLRYPQIFFRPQLWTIQCSSFAAKKQPTSPSKFRKWANKNKQKLWANKNKQKLYHPPLYMGDSRIGRFHHPYTNTWVILILIIIKTILSTHQEKQNLKKKTDFFSLDAMDIVHQTLTTGRYGQPSPFIASLMAAER